MNRTRVATLLAALLLAAPAWTEDEPGVAFVDVTVVDGAGGTTQRTTVLVRDGRVTAVGGDVPDGVRRIAVEGAVLTPGLIDAACRSGYVAGDGEWTREMTAGVDVLDLVDLRSVAFADAVAEGVTTVLVVPGASNVVAGTGRVLATRGEHGKAAPIADTPRPLQVTLSSDASSGNFPPRRSPTSSIYARRPNTRMGVVWMLRQVFLAAKGVQEIPNDADLAPYREVLAGDRPLRVRAHRNSDVTATLRIGDETGFTPVFEGGEEAYLSRDELARRDVPVILGPFPDERSGIGPDYTDSALANARLLHEAGVRVALTAGAHGPRRLRDQAMYAVRYGLPREVALAAVTGTAAAVCGLEGRGRVRTGCVADLVLWSGDPHAPTSRPLVVLVAGRVVHEAPPSEEKTR